MLRWSITLFIALFFGLSSFAQSRNTNKTNKNDASNSVLGKRVVLKELGISFQPPKGWKKKGEYSWQSNSKTDKSSNMNIKATAGSGKTDSLIKNKEMFIDMLKKQYSQIKKGKFTLKDYKIETIGNKKVLVTYGEAEMMGLSMKNLQAFFETPKKIYIFTFTTLKKDWERMYPIIRKCLESVKFL